MNEKVLTFGCRLNIYESELIRKHLSSLKAGDDVLVMNSCAVTAEAERQLRQAIRKAHKENPDLKIVVTGCAAQLDPLKYAAMPGVLRVIGNQEKLSVESYKNLSSDGNDTIAQAQKISVNDIMSVSDTALHLIDGFENNVRGFLQIQNGCNHRCTFCIIPYARGNSRSVPVTDIIDQAKILVDRGYNEIVLTGVDITDYGNDLPEKLSLGVAVKSLLDGVPNLQRLRLSSIDVAEVDEELIKLFASDSRMMPNIHLSLQSGDDMVLKRMKRRHLREDIKNFYYKIKELRPEITFGADIIAGFPTESDLMFQNTYDLLSELDIIFMHVFPYSERQNTPASRMPQVAKEVRRERAKALRSLCNTKVLNHYKNSVRKRAKVLIEKNGAGRAEDFSQVRIAGAESKNRDLIGKVLQISLTELSSDGVLLGNIV
ncbi:tRNA (N(6)-L-threonylcarbamoyladenosine(37)-C(2))-methylthiotransferase MtaB [Candidatus Lariskella endosymbiont of Hedychridium roseum]|uniref:tRNA (N(6)-L-threonylcarbamoyladenosine(37)-C(2))- methylthiotransferase MtaB n=1 Tax=Candidatus Lariskella endosymbiont of Hedychridium roseum TaxID=3077949 RepID=UPI0030D4CB1C